MQVLAASLVVILGTHHLLLMAPAATGALDMHTGVGLFLAQPALASPVALSDRDGTHCADCPTACLLLAKNVRGRTTRPGAPVPSRGMITGGLPLALIVPAQTARAGPLAVCSFIPPPARRRALLQVFLL